MQEREDVNSIAAAEHFFKLGKVTEPVDTIFVKSVRENGPAALNGLCVGKENRRPFKDDYDDEG